MGDTRGAKRLRHKGSLVPRSWPVGAWLGTKKAKDKILSALAAAGPLTGWIERHVI